MPLLRCSGCSSAHNSNVHMRLKKSIKTENFYQKISVFASFLKKIEAFKGFFKDLRLFMTTPPTCVLSGKIILPRRSFLSVICFQIWGGSGAGCRYSEYIGKVLRNSALQPPEGGKACTKYTKRLAFVWENSPEDNSVPPAFHFHFTSKIYTMVGCKCQPLLFFATQRAGGSAAFYFRLTLCLCVTLIIQSSGYFALALSYHFHRFRKLYNTVINAPFFCIGAFPYLFTEIKI